MTRQQRLSKTIPFIVVWFALHGWQNLQQVAPAQGFGINGIFQSLYDPHASIPGSTVDVSDNFPTSYSINETNLTGGDDSGFFSTSHKFYFSANNGSSPRFFMENEAFDISFDMTIDTPNPAPRKSAGFNLESFLFSSSQYVAHTNDSLLPHGDPPGTIVATGTPFPFQSFGNIYNAGETINMRLIYLPPTRSASSGEFIETGVMEFVVTTPSDGELLSGLIDLNQNAADPNDLPGVPDNSWVGLRMQSSARSSTPNDSVTVTFEQFEIAELMVNGGGDFDADDTWGLLDIDALVAAIVAGEDEEIFDLTGDGFVNDDDLSQWLANAGYRNNASRNPYLEGDANLDGTVDVSDFNAWNNSKFTTVAAWSAGDFNADGSVDASDFNIWNANKFQTSDTNVVPEPGGLFLVAWALLAVLTLNRKRSVR